MSKSKKKPSNGAAKSGSGGDYELRELEARLERRMAVLEKQRGRAVIATFLGGLGVAVGLVSLFAVLVSNSSRAESLVVGNLEAEEIVLRDADGIERGRLATNSDGGAKLALSDIDGRERIRLTVLPDGSPGVTISDREARPRAVLAYLPDGTTNLVFADAQGISRAVVGLDPDGSTQALFADQVGTIRTVVGVGADGEPAVTTFNPVASAGDDDDDDEG